MRRPRAATPAAGVAARRATGRLAESAPAGQQAPKRSRVVSEATQAKTDALSVLQASMSEAELQRHVEEALEARGYLFWHVRDSRLMRAGLPDIIAVHPTKVPRRVLFWELKREKGRVTQKQREALAALSDVYGIDARIVRPADWVTLSEEV